VNEVSSTRVSASNKNTAAIALGSNLGDREANLNTAIEHIRSLGKVTAVSSFHKTAPVGYVDQPQFLNAAILLQTELPSVDLMHALLNIEKKMGRDRLLYGEDVLNSKDLVLPHPSMHERAFVLAPLVEIAAGMRHPLKKRTIKNLLDEQ
jgi:2-amino-4-hydroxy-6-hydroxymethyldihydropteridine diphosphokinase